MENIIDKLKQVKSKDNKPFADWSVEEIRKLLDIYLVISKKEQCIFNLIYSYHECDSWEDIFRDYDIQYLKDKKEGVKVAIKGLSETTK
jgi:hypothetical protein